MRRARTLLGGMMLALALTASAAAAAEKPVITVGSKAFTESYVLGEIISQIIENAGEARVNRHFGMGATGILFEAVRTGSIDLYPEYSGTLSEAILKDPSQRELGQIRRALEPMGLTISDSLGFNNTYALAVRGDLARQKGLHRISDLTHHPELRSGFSYEFVNRADGYRALKKAYGLPALSMRPMEHSLAYEALARHEIDLVDVYSTDAKIQKLGLTVLDDDRGFFPKYLAVLLARADFAQKFPRTWAALRQALEGRINETRMQELNAQADLEKRSFPEIARSFLKGESAPSGASVRSWSERLRWPDLLLRTRQHLVLVALSLLAAVLVGVPLGILSARHRRLGQLILNGSGVLQTIPSLALLCFLIPAFGVGNAPALVALFLYALLPIVSNTYLGLTQLNIGLRESARALGLSPWQRLRMIELPLASPSILAGVRTSAIIGIGTATLAALIGAGGYGVPIVTGLALNDIPTILRGAVPAALLALVAHGFFNRLGRWVIPRGIR